MRLPQIRKPDLRQKCQQIRKPNFSGIRDGFRTRAFRAGGYSAAATAIIIAIAVFINILAGALPAAFTQFDITSGGLYSISEETENVLSDLEDDITIYWIVQDGQEDVTLERLLERYEAMSDKIDVVKRDPDVYPTFMTQYNITDVYNNSMIVESGDDFRYVSYEDVYEYSYSGYSYDTSFAGESVLTSAINYVISEDMPKIYTLTGHGEADIASTFASAVQNANIEAEDLSLITNGQVPEDADAVMIYAPSSDISAEEKEILAAYLEEDGSLILITDPMEEDEFANLRELMAGYGVTAEEGIVIEADQDHYLMGAPYYLLPDLSSHEITGTLSENGYYVLMPISQGLSVSSNLPDGVTVSQLLTTSGDSYSKVAGYSLTTYAREDGDIDGPFTLAVAITDTAGDDTESKIIWISSASMLEETVDQRVSGGNQDFFLNCINWVCDREESISIHAKSVNYEYLTIDSGSASTLIALVVVIIPLTYLAAGVYVWVRRKRR